MFLGSGYWDLVAWTMLHFLWIGAALALVCALVRLLLRQAPPQIRYVATLAFLLLVSIAPAAIFATLAMRETARPVASGPIEENRAANLADAALLAGTSSDIGEAAGALSAATPAPGQVDRWLARALQWADNFVHGLPWLWLAGAPLTLAYLMTGLAGAERLRRTAQEITDGPLAEWRLRWCDAWAIGRKVTIATSQRVSSPILLGITRPLILLPPSLVTGLPMEQLEMVLLHELAHVRRWDNLVNLVQRLIEAALFFQPAVWKISAWVRLDREQCCDAAVLEHLGPPQVYAETLASLAVPGLAPRHAVAALANHQLVLRIRHILKREERTMRLSLRSMSFVAAALVASVALVTAWAQSPPPGGTLPEAGVGASASPTDAAVNVSEFQFFANLMGGSAAVRRTCSGLGVGDVNDDGIVDVFLASSGEVINSSQCSNCHGEVSTQHAFDHQVYSAIKHSLQGSAWGAEQATGPPNTTPGHDAATAWASRTTDGQDEWLEVKFDAEAAIAAVMIHETLNPGAVKAIDLMSGQGGTDRRPAWTGDDPIGRGKPGMSIIQLRDQPTANGLRLWIQSREVPGWNEIDAVGVIDTQGQVHWAVSAQASSTFAETMPRQMQRTQDPRDQKIHQLEDQLKQLQRELQNIKSAQTTGNIHIQTSPAGTSGTSNAAGQFLGGLQLGVIGASDAGSAAIEGQSDLGQGKPIAAELAVSLGEGISVGIAEADADIPRVGVDFEGSTSVLLAEVQRDEVARLKEQLQDAQAKLTAAQAAMAAANESQAHWLWRQVERSKADAVPKNAGDSSLLQAKLQGEAAAANQDAVDGQPNPTEQAQLQIGLQQLAADQTATSQHSPPAQPVTSAEMSQTYDRVNELQHERSLLLNELHATRRRERTARILEQATKRELDELSVERQQAKAELAEATAAGAAEAEFSVKSANLAAAERQLAEAKSALRGVLKDLNVSSMERDELEKELSNISNELAKFQQRLKKLEFDRTHKSHDSILSPARP